MLPFPQKVAFLIFAVAAFCAAAYTWRRLFRQVRAGRPDTDERWNNIAARLWYSLVTTLTQRRTFRKRPIVSFFHSLIFYGFVFYLLVNLVDALEGFFPFTFSSGSAIGATYNLLSDALSACVLVSVVALLLRRFFLPARRDFTFNKRTLLHPQLKRGFVRFDSVVVSVFIFFHVASRAIGAGAKLAVEGSDKFQPFGSLLSHAFRPATAEAWRIFGYWGALGSVLAFLAYFPRSKHIHIFMAPAKYVVARDVGSGVLPAIELEPESEEPSLGANKLEDLAWPRLLDAYACIQCNRCQDVCPATATGKSLSPSALEINKRMELNELSKTFPAFGSGSPSPKPLLQFAMTPEAAWACTTCGACMEVCPVQDEPMLDIIDIRRQQVMMEGSFPAQLQSAFRGMERANNPWGLSQEKRLDWADGLDVKTTDQNPEPDVLYWVGCAASYDPQAQKTARAFVQLLNHAGVDFAVLGKRECCTGDSARRAGNEFLYRQLADKNVATLNTIKPKQIVATCPHCMNAVGKEYAQLGGDFRVIHHTEFLDGLVREGKLTPNVSSSTVAFHDPCYLGRHNGVYDAPRNLLKVLSSTTVELDRNRDNSFCCGAGGAQFWKEEEPGDQRISDNRFAEAERKLSSAEDKVLAVGCPFCKSMLDSTPGKERSTLAVKDIAELLLEGLQVTQHRGASPGSELPEVSAGIPDDEFHETEAPKVPAQQASAATEQTEQTKQCDIGPAGASLPKVLAAEDFAKEQPATSRRKWVPKRQLPAVAQALAPSPAASENAVQTASQPSEPTARKAWNPQRRLKENPTPSQAAPQPQIVAPQTGALSPVSTFPTAGTADTQEATKRKTWKPKVPSSVPATVGREQDPAPAVSATSSPESSSQTHLSAQTSQRKRWIPKRNMPSS